MSMNIIELVSAVSGGLLSGGLFSYLIGKKKQNSDDFAKVIELFKEDNVRLRKSEEENRERLIALERKLLNLQNKLLLLETAHSDLPLPMWLKDLDGTVLSLNKAYEDAYLLPIGKTILDYLGHTDYEIWPKDVADAFANHDKMCLQKGRLDAMEPVWNGVELTQVRVIKYVRKVNNVPIGIAGISIPLSSVQS